MNGRNPRVWDELGQVINGLDLMEYELDFDRNGMGLKVQIFCKNIYRAKIDRKYQLGRFWYFWAKRFI